MALSNLIQIIYISHHNPFPSSVPSWVLAGLSFEITGKAGNLKYILEVPETSNKLSIRDIGNKPSFYGF